MINKQILSDLYDNQPVFVEKLPGTTEWVKLVAEYRTATDDFKISSDLLWQELNKMRKAGELVSKSTKVKKVPAKETWPDRMTGKGYRILVPLQVNASMIEACVYFNETLPVSRAEAHDIVCEKFTVFHDGWADEIDEDRLTVVRARTKQLFPELYPNN